MSGLWVLVHYEKQNIKKQTRNNDCVAQTWTGKNNPKYKEMSSSSPSTQDRHWPTGCRWTTQGPCSEQPMDKSLWDTPLRCCLAKQTPLPSLPLTQSAETLTGGRARTLYWQAATTNQSTEGCSDHVCRHWERCCLVFYSYPKGTIELNVSIAGLMRHKKQGCCCLKLQ